MTVGQPGSPGPGGRPSPGGQPGGQPDGQPGGQAGPAPEYDAPPTRSIRRLTRTSALGVVAPSRVDPVARAASQLIGGPSGRRLASASGFWRASSVLVLLSIVVLMFGVIQKEHCRSTGWNSPDQFWHACYSDIPVLYGSVGLGGVARPGLVDAVDSGALGPPLQAAAMWTVSSMVSSGDAAHAPRRFFDLSAIMLGGALIVTVLLVVAGSGRRPWDAAHVALAPMIATAALLSYDLFALALMAGALVAWSRRRPIAAGVLLGLAVDTRPMTAVVAVAVVAVAVRAGRTAPALDLVGAAFTTWIGVRLLLFPGLSFVMALAIVGVLLLVATVAMRIRQLPVGAALGTTAAAVWLGTQLLTGLMHVPGLNVGLSHSWQVWKGGTPGYGSIWLVPQLLSESRPGSAGWWYTGPPLSASATTAASLLATLAVLVVGVLLALSSGHRPRIAHLALFMVAGCLLVAKSLPVQASLVLLPLVALAGLRWRDHLMWALAEVSYFVGTWLYIAAGSVPDRGLPAGFYLVLLLWRLAMIGWLAVLAARRCIDPVRDPVREPEEGGAGADDPLGGPVDGVQDALTLRLA